MSAPRFSAITTFRLGGGFRWLWQVSDPLEMQAAVQTLHSSGEPWRVVGGGSNLLVSDQGLDVVVLHYACEQPVCEIMPGGLVRVTGSTFLDALALFSVEQGLQGLAFASGIPGTVGGAIAGNAGAFGAAVGDCLESAQVLFPDGSSRDVPRDFFQFDYRATRLAREPLIVLSASFRLPPGDPGHLREERARILALRRDKHPDWKTQPTAGSFFKNLPPAEPGGKRQAAGWFLERVGAKEMRVGGAHAFEKHANIIIADSGSTAQDVVGLTRQMAAAVREKFSIALEPEVRLWGAF